MGSGGGRRGEVGRGGEENYEIIVPTVRKKYLLVNRDVALLTDFCVRLSRRLILFPF